MQIKNMNLTKLNIIHNNNKIKLRQKKVVIKYQNVSVCQNKI